MHVCLLDKIRMKLRELRTILIDTNGLRRQDLAGIRIDLIPRVNHLSGAKKRNKLKMAFSISNFCS